METFRKAREIKLGPLLLLVGFANQTSINLSSTAVFAAVAKQSNRCSKTSFPCEELLLLLVRPGGLPSKFLLKSSGLDSCSVELESTLMMQPEEKIRKGEYKKESTLMMQPEEKIGEEDVKSKVEPESTLMMQCEDKLSEGEDVKNKVELESTLMMQPEEKIGEGEDVKNKEDIISQDYGSSSNSYGTNLSLYRNRKRFSSVRSLFCSFETGSCTSLLHFMLPQWYKVRFAETHYRDEQSELHSIYRHRSIRMFEAYMTYAEAQKVRALEEVAYVGLVPMSDNVQSAKRTKSGIFEARPKSKKQKRSLGSILSERRQNKEKWRYNEDLEQEAKIEDSEEEDFSEDEWSRDYSGSSDTCEGYYGFDEFGKRWYKVCLSGEKAKDDQVALLLDVLNCEQSGIRSIYIYHTPDLFKARMTEEEADRVAGLGEVEFVEPLSYIIALD
ncbi:hypothetical protein SCA6_000927 [Theobroma cacao]